MPATRRPATATPFAVEPLEPRRHLSGTPLHTSLTAPQPHEGAAWTSDSRTRAFFFGGNNVVNTAPRALTVFDKATGQWSTHDLPGDQPLPRFAGPVGDSTFVVAFHDRVAVLDLPTGAWSFVDQPDWPGPAHGAGAVVGGKVVLAGAGSFDADTYRARIFDPATSAWRAARLSEARNIDTVATLGRLAFFAGGYYGFKRAASDTVDIFDASTNGWTVTHLSQPRTAMTVGTVGTRVFFAGGYDLVLPGVSSSDLVDIYDTATRRWSTAHLSRGVMDPDIVTVGPRVCFVHSGGVIDIFDSVTGRWSVVPAPRSASLNLYVSATALGDQLILAGNAAPTGTYNRTAYAYAFDPATAKWTRLPFDHPRYHPSAVTVGTRALFGGGPDTGDDPDAADIYTDSNPTPALSGFVGSNFGRTGAVATILTNTGDAPLAAPFTVALYANPRRRAIDADATLVGRLTVTPPLAPGDSVRLAIPLTTPTSLPAGRYDLIAAARPSTSPARDRLVYAAHKSALHLAAPTAAPLPLPAPPPLPTLFSTAAVSLRPGDDAETDTDVLT